MYSPIARACAETAAPRARCQNGCHVHLIGVIGGRYRVDIAREFSPRNPARARLPADPVASPVTDVVAPACSPRRGSFCSLLPAAASSSSHPSIMFSKKLHVDVKKSTLKIQDVKKDSATRFKHLKIVLGWPLFNRILVNLRKNKQTEN